MARSKGLTKQSEDFSAWYNEVVQEARLASHSAVRGCMVIRPYGYRIWELMQRALDDMFKATGHQNAYFPLFLPKSALDREAEHFAGFAPEVALVTHAGRGGELEEPLVVRPTSEAIIWPILADWIQSYRDLPILLNQWANVVRWELRTRPFLRTTEFLWQEGHTAHASQADAQEETRRMLGVYRTFMEDWMAMPVITGEKTESERFAGADRTFALEALMKDNKALQVGTSHDLGQNFARAFDVRYQTEAGEHDYVWSTSWGVSTRMIGALIMTHGDDTGLIVPPRLAPHHVVIVPIYKNEDQRAATLEAASRVAGGLEAAGLRVHVDERDGMNPGAKFYEWERCGVPLRIEIGPRDVESGGVVVVRRITAADQDRKTPMPEAEAIQTLSTVLDSFQSDLLVAARQRREENTSRGVTDYGQFQALIADRGGFVFCGWCGDAECEARIKEDTKATIRVLPDEEFRSAEAPSTCLCGSGAQHEAVWARGY
ncbi:MAG: proline--tRNA ligase [Gemmatimonadota bacterium]